MRWIDCLQEVDGFLTPVTLSVEARGGEPHEAELGSRLRHVGTDTVVGWGGLDGEAAIVAHDGASTFRVPIARWRALKAWAAGEASRIARKPDAELLALAARIVAETAAKLGWPPDELGGIVGAVIRAAMMAETEPGGSSLRIAVQTADGPARGICSILVSWRAPTPTQVVVADLSDDDLLSR